MFLLALVHVASKPGRAWAAIRESEPAALAAGVNITLYKMWAFALASFMTGVAGCLLAAQVGQPRATGFPVQDSLILLATALIGGIFSLRGAIVAGVFYSLVPFIFRCSWGSTRTSCFIIFGVGLLQVLLTAPGGIVQQFPKDMANLGRLDRARRPGARRRSREVTMIEVDGLTVRFAGITPIDDMSVVFAEWHLRSDRAERRRQDDVLQRPQRVRQAGGGSIRAFGEDLLKLADYRRARWGLRRTFQTEMAIEQLSVFDNVAMIHEHSGAKRSTRRSEVLSAIEFVGLDVSPSDKGRRARRSMSGAWSRSRAQSSANRGSCLLDEPAAGLPDEETEHLGTGHQEDPRVTSARCRFSSTTT